MRGLADDVHALAGVFILAIARGLVRDPVHDFVDELVVNLVRSLVEDIVLPVRLDIAVGGGVMPTVATLLPLASALVVARVFYNDNGVRVVIVAVVRDDDDLGQVSSRISLNTSDTRLSRVGWGRCLLGLERNRRSLSRWPRRGCWLILK